MKRSEQRILTTHAGSLLRPKALGEMHGRLSRGEPVAAAEMAQATFDATRHVVKMQAECGIDVGNNGEQARESFFTYVKHRMSGFGGQSDRPRFADMWEFPSFLEEDHAAVRGEANRSAPRAQGDRSSELYRPSAARA